jgi:hypothetical protein
VAAEGVVEVAHKVSASRIHTPTEHLFKLALSPEEVKSAIQPLERRAPQQAALLRHLLQTGAATAVGARA